MKWESFPIMAALLITTTLAPAASIPIPTTRPAPPSRTAKIPLTDMERFIAFWSVKTGIDLAAVNGKTRIVEFTTFSLPQGYVMVYSKFMGQGSAYGSDRYLIRPGREIEPWSMKALSGAFTGNYPTEEAKVRLMRQMIDWNEGPYWIIINSAREIPGYDRSTTESQRNRGGTMGSMQGLRGRDPAALRPRLQRKLDKDLEGVIQPQWQESCVYGPNQAPGQTTTFCTFHAGVVRRYQFIFSDKHDFIEASDLELGRGIGTILSVH